MFPYNLCIAKILIITDHSPGEAEMSAKAEERESRIADTLAPSILQSH